MDRYSPPSQTLPSIHHLDQFLPSPRGSPQLPPHYAPPPPPQWSPANSRSTQTYHNRPPSALSQSRTPRAPLTRLDMTAAAAAASLDTRPPHLVPTHAHRPPPDHHHHQRADPSPHPHLSRGNHHRHQEQHDQHEGEDEIDDGDEHDSATDEHYQPDPHHRTPASMLDHQLSEPAKKKRKRQALSCTECKRRKIKCDRNHPCGPCLRRGEQDKCKWHVIESTNDRFVTRAEHEDLKRHVQRLHAMVVNTSPSSSSPHPPPPLSAGNPVPGPSTASTLPVSPPSATSSHHPLSTDSRIKSETDHNDPHHRPMVDGLPLPLPGVVPISSSFTPIPTSSHKRPREEEYQPRPRFPFRASSFSRTCSLDELDDILRSHILPLASPNPNSPIGDLSSIGYYFTHLNPLTQLVNPQYLVRTLRTSRLPLLQRFAYSLSRTLNVKSPSPDSGSSDADGMHDLDGAEAGSNHTGGLPDVEKEAGCVALLCIIPCIVLSKIGAEEAESRGLIGSESRRSSASASRSGAGTRGDPYYHRTTPPPPPLSTRWKERVSAFWDAAFAAVGIALDGSGGDGCRTIEVIQTLILSTQCDLALFDEKSILHPLSPHKTTIALAIQLAHSLGLSRLGSEPESHRLVPNGRENGKENSNSNDSDTHLLTRQVGRCVWWNLVILDWNFSTVTQSSLSNYSSGPGTCIYTISPAHFNTGIPASGLNPDWETGLQSGSTSSSGGPGGTGDQGNNTANNRRRPSENGLGPRGLTPTSSPTTTGDFSALLFAIKLATHVRELADRRNTAVGFRGYEELIEHENKVKATVSASPKWLFERHPDLERSLPHVQHGRIATVLSIYGHEIWLHRFSILKGYEDAKFSRSITACVSAARGILATIEEADQAGFPGFKSWALVGIPVFSAAVVLLIDQFCARDTRESSDERRAMVFGLCGILRNLCDSSRLAQRALYVLEYLQNALDEQRSGAISSSPHPGHSSTDRRSQARHMQKQQQQHDRLVNASRFLDSNTQGSLDSWLSSHILYASTAASSPTRSPYAKHPHHSASNLEKVEEFWSRIFSLDIPVALPISMSQQQPQQQPLSALASTAVSLAGSNVRGSHPGTINRPQHPNTAMEQGWIELRADHDHRQAPAYQPHIRHQRDVAMRSASPPIMTSDIRSSRPMAPERINSH